MRIDLDQLRLPKRLKPEGIENPMEAAPRTLETDLIQVYNPQ